MRLRGFIFVLSVVLWGCSSEPQTDVTTDPTPTTEHKLLAGNWRAALNLGEEELPFNFIVEDDHIMIINGEERIRLEDISIEEDSFIFRLPLFDSEFVGRFHNDSLIQGIWRNYNKGKAYEIPFVAEYGKDYRFVTEETDEPTLIGGSWEVDFSPGTDEMYKAKAIFKNDGNKLFGTFLTETGDYRFLEGCEVNNKLYLSCFDGSHAFLFKADRTESDSLKGTFWSGTHWKESWVAARNNDFELKHPDSLTHLVVNNEKINFNLPDAENNMVSLSDARFQDKVVIVQIMGTWCPNCMDETEFYAELYKKYKSLGLEIVAVAFEKNNEVDKFKENLDRVCKKYDCSYTHVLGGKADKSHAHEIFPMLNNVIAYPTSIFIDKQGNVRKVHTGFYGPGTGDYYTRYRTEIIELLESMLRE